MASSISNRLYTLANKILGIPALLMQNTQYVEGFGDRPPALHHLPRAMGDSYTPGESLLTQADLEHLRSHAADSLVDDGVMDRLYEAVYRTLFRGQLSHVIRPDRFWSEEHEFGARLLELTLMLEQGKGALSDDEAVEAVERYRAEWDDPGGGDGRCILHRRAM